MKYISRCLSFVFILAVVLAGGARAVEGGVNIFFVDENDKAFDAETVRWWYSGQRSNKTELKCVDERCDERLLKQAWSGAIIVAADTAVVEPDDGSCWKLYHGEALLDSPVQKIKIVMRYKNKVCK